MSEIIITQTVSPKNYCKYERTMCEFANDRGYCVKTGCTKRIIINEVPKVNKNLVEVVRCKDCKHRPRMPEDAHYREVFELEFPDDICPLQCGDRWYNREPDDDWFCANGERDNNKQISIEFAKLMWDGEIQVRWRKSDD